MKVCILTSSFPRFNGDYAGCFIYDLARELAKNSFRITVIAPSDVETKRYEHKEGMNIIRFSYFFKRKFQKLTYNLGMPYNFKKSLLAKFQIPAFFFFFMCKSLPQVLKSDIIWSHWIMPSGLLGAVFNKLIRKRHIMTVHSTGGLPLLKNSLFRHLVLKFIFRHTDEIVAVSSCIKGELLRFSPFYLRSKIEKKLHIVPMGINRQLYQSRIDKETLRRKYNINTQYVILFLGRLVEIKGVAYLIEAVRDLDNYTLIIAGEGDRKEILMDLAKKLAVNVRWTDTISGRQKTDYLSLCDLIAVPSIVTSSGESEGLPVVVLEALACAKPVLASKTGGMPDVIKDGYNGFLVSAQDIPAISERLKEMLNNQTLLNQMGNNASSYSRRFDLNLIGEKYARIMNK